jgi:methylenetetrahydrofolate dehydrogenase (NADP+)/methenyltetrahydrofolate cyclohydrolase
MFPIMETKEIKGAEYARKIREEVRAEVERLKAQGISPQLATVVAGNDPAIAGYLEVKRRTAEKLGITLEMVGVQGGEKELVGVLQRLSKSPATHGIILELPLPSDFDADRVIQTIHPKKDVDGLTAVNLGLALAGREDEALLSATAQACIALAETFGSLKGKRVTLLGKGRTVGKPLIPMLLNRGATLTVVHSKTSDLKQALQGAEVIFSGTGQAGILTGEMLSNGQIVIDAGTAYENGKVLGDVASDAWGVAAAVTPVPEGVGPLTTAYVFRNLIRAIALQS